MELSKKPRLSIVLNVQDAAITKSSTFFPNTIKGVSTVEAYYSVINSDGTLALSGVSSETTQTPAMNFADPTLEGKYSKTLAPPSPEC